MTVLFERTFIVSIVFLFGRVAAAAAACPVQCSVFGFGLGERERGKSDLVLDWSLVIANTIRTAV